MSVVVEVDTPQGSFSRNLEMVQVRSLSQDCFLEFIGTFTFVYISIAGVNQTVLSGGSQLEVALCFAVGLTSGILIAGKSGGHLNPAVSFTTFMTDSDFNYKRLFGYVLSQLLGGFAAGLLVLAVYYSWIDKLPDSNVMIGAFGTLRNQNNSLFASIIDQFVGSAFLMFGIAFTPLSWSKPLTIGTVLGGLALFQGSNGFAFNLARDMGPRIASAIVFGSDPFSLLDSWFWVPMVVPFFGVPFGLVAARFVQCIQ